MVLALVVVMCAVWFAAGWHSRAWYDGGEDD